MLVKRLLLSSAAVGVCVGGGQGVLCPVGCLRRGINMSGGASRAAWVGRVGASRAGEATALERGISLDEQWWMYSIGRARGSAGCLRCVMVSGEAGRTSKTSYHVFAADVGTRMKSETIGEYCHCQASSGNSVA
jgi:hypothetical protein